MRYPGFLGVSLVFQLTLLLGFFFPPPPPPGGWEPPAPPPPPPAEVDGVGLDGACAEDPGFPLLADVAEAPPVLVGVFFGVLRRGMVRIPPGPYRELNGNPCAFLLLSVVRCESGRTSLIPPGPGAGNSSM